MASPRSTRRAQDPVRSADAVRVCSKAGITTTQQKLITLRQLRAGLDEAIKELDEQRRTDAIVNRAKLVTQFTKATCDAFVAMAAEMASMALPEAVGKQAKFVASASQAGSALADAAGTAMAGGRVDYVSTGTRVAKAVSKNMDDGSKLLVQSAVVKVDVLTRALNHDSKGVIKKAAEYSWDLHANAASIAKYKKVSAFMKIAKQGFEYDQAVATAFDEMLDAEDESLQRWTMLKSRLSSQARLLSARIRELEAHVASCS